MVQRPVLLRLFLPSILPAPSPGLYLLSFFVLILCTLFKFQTQLKQQGFCSFSSSSQHRKGQSCQLINLPFSIPVFFKPALTGRAQKCGLSDRVPGRSNDKDRLWVPDNQNEKDCCNPLPCSLFASLTQRCDKCTLNKLINFGEITLQVLQIMQICKIKTNSSNSQMNHCLINIKTFDFAYIRHSTVSFILYCFADKLNG